jgi:ABC-type sugar transport system ATPase subunit
LIITLGNVISNDYVVPAVKCRDISMVVQRLYSGNVIINDYVVPAVKCRDIPMVVRRLYSGNVIVNDYVVPAVKCRDIPMVVRRHCQNKDAGRPLVYLYILQPELRNH